MIVAKHPVKVTCVHPGGVKTAIARSATMSGDVDERKLTDAFEKYFLRMDAAKAADIIIRGVEKAARASSSATTRRRAGCKRVRLVASGYQPIALRANVGICTARWSK